MEQFKRLTRLNFNLPMKIVKKIGLLGCLAFSQTAFSQDVIDEVVPSEKQEKYLDGELVEYNHSVDKKTLIRNWYFAIYHDKYQGQAKSRVQILSDSLDKPVKISVEEATGDYVVLDLDKNEVTNARLSYEGSEFYKKEKKLRKKFNKLKESGFEQSYMSGNEARIYAGSKLEDNLEKYFYNIDFTDNSGETDRYLSVEFNAVSGDLERVIVQEKHHSFYVISMKDNEVYSLEKRLF